MRIKFGSCLVKGELGTVGWTVSNLDSLWGSSVWYFCQFKADVSFSYKDYQATYKGEKRKELMWIHHFAILQLFHPKFHMEKDICFEHENSGLFLCQLTFDETQEYMNLFHDSPRYEWLWLGKNYRYVDRLWFGEINWYCIGFWCWSLSVLSYSTSINFKR